MKYLHSRSILKVNLLFTRLFSFRVTAVLALYLGRYVTLGHFFQIYYFVDYRRYRYN